MTAAPADSIYIEIQAQLDKLRADMSRAEKVVDDSTKRMDQTTKKRGLFGVGGGLNFERFAGIAGGLRLAQAGLEGINAAFDKQGEPAEKFIAGVEATANTLTFGLSGALNKAIDHLTGYTASLKEVEDRTKSLDAAQKQLAAQAPFREAVRNVRQQLGISEASTPEQKAIATLRAQQEDIGVGAAQFRKLGVPESQIQQGFVAPSERIAKIEAGRKLYGPVPAETSIRLLQQIANQGARGF